MKLTQSIYQLTFLVVLLVAFAGYNFMFADAPANPPANNVAAPINVGGTNQIKSGGLSLASLLVTGSMIVDGPTATFNQTRASEYCDKSGENCLDPVASQNSVEYNFGGMYSVTTPGGCQTVNVMTGECSCGTGYVDKQSATSGDYRCADGDHGRVECSGEDMTLHYCILAESLPSENTFVTRFNELNFNDTFRAWYGPGDALPAKADPDRTAHGWYHIGSTRTVDTLNKLCSYMRVGGTYAGNAKYADYGSDNNNRVWEWDVATKAWISTGHGSNGAVDVTQLDCAGGNVTPQGNIWRKSVHG